MTIQLSAVAVDPAPIARAVRRPGRHSWHAALAVLAASSAFLTAWGSWDGSRSDYYASIALSMSRSWSNLFFGALDPAGTVTLDKIPGSYWVPALFVKVFGFSTFSVVLPNALAAVAATLIAAVTARRIAGRTAGWIAGAVVATTPVLVAVSRSNQPESFFVLGLTLAAWAAVRALQTARMGWLVLAGAFIAASFQAYMLEAWALWPALAAAYLCTRQSFRRRVGHLLVAGAVSAALSLTWIAIVSFIPSGSRPYLGSTLHDSPWELVFGYNGLGRFGQATADGSAYNSFTPPFSGDPGVLRLFDTLLAGQIAWLIPAALLAVIVLAVLRVPTAVWVFLGGWLITFAAMFSVVAGMHQFYTAALALPMGLAIGAAFGAALKRRLRWPVIALLATAAITSGGIAALYSGFSSAAAAAQTVAGGAACLLLVLSVRRSVWMRRAGVVLATAGLVLTPAVWSAVTIAHPSAINPVAGGVSDMAGMGGGFARGPGGGLGGTGRPGAGPGTGGTGGSQSPLGSAGPTGGVPFGAPVAGGQAGPNGGRFGGAITGSADETALLSFLRAHPAGGRYRIAVFGAQAAAHLIIQSDGASVLPIGGFSGDDPVPTLSDFTAMVQTGDIRFVLTSGSGGGFGGAAATASGQILQWVRSHCTTVTAGTVPGLYSCAAS